MSDNLQLQDIVIMWGGIPTLASDVVQLLQKYYGYSSIKATESVESAIRNGTGVVDTGIKPWSMFHTMMVWERAANKRRRSSDQVLPDYMIRQELIESNR